MISHFKGLYSVISIEIPQGGGPVMSVFVCVAAEMRKRARLMEIRSHCCLTAGTFAVIARVINL